MGEGPEYELVQKLLPKLTAVEFLKLTLSNLDAIAIESEEALLLLDKVMYKTATISKDFKMLLLPPEIQEKFLQRMKEMKLDENNFMSMLQTYEKGKGPYVKPPAVPEPPKAPQDVAQRQYKPDIPEKLVAAPVSEKRQPSYGGSARPVEKKEAPKRRARSSSSSSSSSSSGEREGYQDKIAKLQKEIARLNASKSSEQRSQPPPNKYSFSLKKPDLPPRSRQVFRPSPPEEESYSRSREPRSERGDRDHREPEAFSPHRSKEYSPPRTYRGGKSYRPPFPYKRGK